MENIFNLDNVIFRTISKIFDWIYLSVLFTISCIPIITIGVAISSLYYTVQKVMKNERDHVTQAYWKSFKKNSKQGIAIWLILFFAMIFLVFDIRLIQLLCEHWMNLSLMKIPYYIMLVFGVAWSMYLFSYLSRFEDSVRVIIKNTGIMAVLHPGRTLLIVMAMLVFCLVIYLFPSTILVMPTLYGFWLNKILEPVFFKYMRKEDIILEKEINENYIDETTDF